MKPLILVKLKMKLVYKMLLSFVGFLLCITVFVFGAYKLYDKVLESSDIEVNGALSINYVDGKVIDVLPNEKKTIELSISNNGERTNFYNIGFKQVRGEGTYTIYNDDEKVAEGILKTIDEIRTDYISIDSKETKIYKIEIVNTGLDELKGELTIYNQNWKIITFADTIIANNPPKDAVTKVGSDVASTDEGLIKSSDDIGVSYYFRGDVQNNYVSFANFRWRIVRINGDGTVRLVLDDVTDTLASYYTEENKDYVFESSVINNYLNTWLMQNLNNYDSYLANAKFCSDINYDIDNNLIAYNRIVVNKIPTLNCLGTSINNSIGLLTIDEVILAGASPSASNGKFYLQLSNNSEVWYTMSAAKTNSNNLNFFMVDKNGGIHYDIAGNLYRNIRPVINLIKNIEVSGTGTIDDPYVIN